MATFEMKNTILRAAHFLKNLEQCGAHCRCQISRTQETSFVVKIPSWKRLGVRVMSFASLIPLIFRRDHALDPSNN